ncbi:ROK family transcriptional regulator [Bacillus sp. FJAT-50079]|uniref:ROK family transcriptional regulator n=1 Tax=Bacillus sp. FJAT-50079 TaxID=2833577 RepID=UPI001BCA530F|nr:ROK family transcriptional regulator [Bacillus sp. FJAT-50079]MBS4208265.1 ROK family transcriptional regulator [Bacillus sp. FJAT-50079]
MEIGSFQGMKSLNRSIVLNKIRISGPISRAEIARDTKLTPPTVSKLVNELLESELIMEGEIGESLGGRKPTLLSVNIDRFHVIGVDVGPKSIRAALCNLSGTIIACSQKRIPFPITNEELLTLLKETIATLATEQEVVGIGIGMHGAVDHEQGIALFAPILHLKNIPIASMLESDFSMPVIVDNDVRALAFGEYWLKNQEQKGTFVTVNLGHGVGAGIVHDGRLFHGEHDLAGEIGHMTIDLSGEQCSCGNIGCWQTLVSGPAIAKEAMRQLAHRKDSTLANQAIEGKTVYEAALAGDPLAIDVLRKTGEYIGIGLTNLIHIFNPTKITIAGGVAKAHEFLLPEIKQTLWNRGLTDQAKTTEIDCSTQDQYGTAIGAATLVLANIFLEN